mgnify:CR=1 FL=1
MYSSSNSYKFNTFIGSLGEQLARDWLLAHGYIIRACNMRTRQGEVDIIAQKQNIIAFVEVKMRTTVYFELSSVITRQKQKRIIAAARWYIAQEQFPLNTYIYRFDVALIEPINNTYQVQYISDAFRVQEYS